jgi:hypothetical protein
MDFAREAAVSLYCALRSLCLLAEANPTTFVAAVGVVGALFSTWFSAHRNRQINLRNKRVDVAIHCNLRFDATHEQKLKLRIGDAEEGEARSYYARLWGLKSDQFDYYLADTVDIETFANWCFMTVRAFSERPDAKTDFEFDFGWGWSKVGAPDHQVANPWFYELTTALKELGMLWRKRGDQFGKENSAASDLEIDAAIGRVLLIELLDILDIVHRKSRFYRKRILSGMSIAEYRRTLRTHDSLGLSIQRRSSNIDSRLGALRVHT